MTYLMTTLTDKGGVGKTMIAAMIAEVCQLAGVDDTASGMALAEADHEGRLGDILGSQRMALRLGAAPDQSEIEQDRRVGERFFNPVYLLAADHDRNTLLDLGGNATTAYLQWALSLDIAGECREDHVTPLGIVIVTPDAAALQSGARAIEQFRHVFGDTGLVTLVENDLTGEGFDALDRHPVGKRLQGQCDTRVRVPGLDGHIAAEGRRTNRTPWHLIEHARTIGEQAGLDRLAIKAERRRLTEWLAHVQDSLIDALPGDLVAREAMTGRAAE